MVWYGLVRFRGIGLARFGLVGFRSVRFGLLWSRLVLLDFGRSYVPVCYFGGSGGNPVCVRRGVLCALFFPCCPIERYHGSTAILVICR